MEKINEKPKDHDCDIKCSSSDSDSGESECEKKKFIEYTVMFANLPSLVKLEINGELVLIVMTLIDFIPPIR